MKRYLVFRKLRSGEIKYSTSLLAKNLDAAILENKKQSCSSNHIVLEKLPTPIIKHDTKRKSTTIS